MENKDLPAYPQPIAECQGAIHETGDYNSCAIGLSKRELIAAMAMQGILSNATCCQGYSPNEDYARQAVAMADTLFTELSKTQP